VAEGYAAWKGFHGGAVAAIALVPGDPCRLISGAADRSLLLWDKQVGLPGLLHDYLHVVLPSFLALNSIIII
jgi:hypothetical protein